MPKTAPVKSLAAKRNDKAAAKKQVKRKRKNSEEDAYVVDKSAKTKKEKDPDAPKKPQTAYFLFMNQKRVEVKEADPSLTFGTLTKKLTEMWRGLDDEARKVYDDLAIKDKERYQAEMEAKGLAKKRADQGAPKKPRTAFILYSTEAREQLKKSEPDLKQTDILKRIGQLWAELEEDKKQEWTEKSEADRKRYEKEMAEFKGAASTGATAGTKRPAHKGTGAGSKKAKKDTQSEEKEGDEDEDDEDEEEEEEGSDEEAEN